MREKKGGVENPEFQAQVPVTSKHSSAALCMASSGSEGEK